MIKLFNPASIANRINYAKPRSVELITESANFGILAGLNFWLIQKNDTGTRKPLSPPGTRRSTFKN